MFIELLGSLNLYYALAIKILAAIIIGGMLGYERAITKHALGIRSAMLFCMGATVFTTISYLNVTTGPHLESLRVVGQIVSGVGFISAAVVFRNNDGIIKGLTTSIEIWCIAALGALIGMGYPLSAFIISLIILGILQYGPKNSTIE